MFIIKADTPEEARAAIVKWLNYNATCKRSDARIARTKTFANEKNKAAEVYEGAAKFIADMKIDTVNPIECISLVMNWRDEYKDRSEDKVLFNVLNNLVTAMSNLKKS